MNTKILLIDWKSIERNYVASKALLDKPENLSSSRLTALTEKIMTIYVTGIQLDPSSNDSMCVYNFSLISPDFGNSSGSFSMTLPTTKELMAATFRAYIVSYVFTLWNIAIADTDVILEHDLYAPLAKAFATPSLAINTARQPSTTRDTLVNASVDITASLSLTTGQKGSVTLRYADDSGFTTNVVNVQVSTNGNTGTLALGLALGQIVTSTVSGIVPAGKYYELLTTNVTGSPTYGTPVIQEVLL